ncbi:hypothetical protein ACMD2_17416 [Ananas comosus]|uniref:Uncharacterized protein n=1 Tax=Ananas comosus TaxID=4615 RepID=A0A199UK76_ANACO|nr:hypothetical protein ACMD2_17416 [Ananas comosus]
MAARRSDGRAVQSRPQPVMVGIVRETCNTQVTPIRVYTYRWCGDTTLQSSFPELINIVHELLYNRGATNFQVLESVCFHNIYQRLGRGQEFEASFFEPTAMVLLRQHQRSGRRAHGNVPTQPIFADQPQPLQPVPICGSKEMLKHRGRRLLRQLLQLQRQRIRIDEVQQSPEGESLHIVDLYALRAPLLHGAEELCPEHRRPSGEQQPGQLNVRCSNPSVSITAASVPGEAMKLRQAAFSRPHRCCSAKANVFATVFTRMFRHNLLTSASRARIDLRQREGAEPSNWRRTPSSSSVALPYTRAGYLSR